MVSKKVIDNLVERDADDKLIAQELVDKIHKMTEDRDAKCASAKEQLIENLKITADKYLTATGVMEALRVMREAYPDGYYNADEFNNEFTHAQEVALTLSRYALRMADKANDLEYTEMDQLCDDMYNEDYTSQEIDGEYLPIELMRLDLCRNVGPAAEDMVEFINRTQQDIDDTQAELDALIAEHPEFADLTSTPKED